MILTPLIYGQDIITFDNQGWNNNRVLTSNLTIGNYIFSSNNNFFTNFGYKFNVNQNCLYFVFQNPSADKITITTKDNSLVKFLSVDAYQVSENSTQSLIIEGWNSSSKLYSKSFSSLNSWQTLSLNYDNINKVIIRITSSSTAKLTDYNFDNFSFQTTTSAPSINSPPLISPPSGATGVSISPTLTWSGVSGASSYNLQISTSSSFSTLTVNQNGITTTSEQVSGLNSGAIYYWRVSASNSSGISGWSIAYRFFTTGTASSQIPAAPSLVSPVSGATNVSLSPIVIWKSSTNAASYRLQVSISSDFSSTIFDQSGITSTSQQLSGLNSGAIYHWRVSASNSSGTSGWSTAFRFFTTGTTSSQIPAAPSLVSPVSGATNVSLSPIVIWKSSTNAASYRLQVSLSSAFSSIIFDQSGITSTSQQLSGLNSGAIYHWRVSASNSSGTSGWSTAFRFFTTGTTSSQIPAAPSLVSPVSGATNVSLSPIVIWKSSTNATSYRLQVSISSDFSSTIFDQSGITSTSQQLSGLNSGAIYHWRVSASNSSGTSSWSTTFRFFTTGTASLSTGNILLAAEDGTLSNGANLTQVVGSASDKVVYYTSLNSNIKFKVNIPKTGTWYVWGRFYFPDETHKSLAIQIDNNEMYPFGNGDNPYSEWNWQANRTSNLKLGNLSAGQHTITIWGKEDSSSTFIDQILLTQDPNFTRKDQGLGLLKSIINSDSSDAIKLLPNKYSLEQNYPNPFNPSTILSFSIPQYRMFL